MNDDELVAAVAAKDSSALRALFDRHSPWVAGRLRRAMPAEDVEDVLQETFIAVWRGARGHRGDGAVGAWIWGIARRQAATRGRKAERNLSSFDQTSMHSASEDIAPRAGHRADLSGAFASLGPDGDEQRELARLVFEEDRSVAEVAQRLGIPEGTVKSRVFKIRQRLQSVLREGGY